MIGKKIHMLEVIERLPECKYLCKCDCGNTRVVYTGHFNSGTVKSCGCHHWHGNAKSKEKSREYTSYHNMIARCHKPSNKRFKDYGAKGILVCDRWLESFQNFLEDMGNCPEGFQIDRINNSHGYFPENCRWVSPKDNMNNRKISRIWIVNGTEFNSISDAARKFSVSQHTIRAWCLGRWAEGRFYPKKDNCDAKGVV